MYHLIAYYLSVSLYRYTYEHFDMNQFLTYISACLSSVVRKITAHKRGLACSPFVLTEHISSYWRASEASETLSGVTNGNRRYIFIYIFIYIYIWYVRPHFSSTVLGLCNVGGVEWQLFLKHSNHWKRH